MSQFCFFRFCDASFFGESRNAYCVASSASSGFQKLKYSFWHHSSMLMHQQERRFFMFPRLLCFLFLRGDNCVGKGVAKWLSSLSFPLGWSSHCAVLSHFYLSLSLHRLCLLSTYTHTHTFSSAFRAPSSSPGFFTAGVSFSVYHSTHSYKVEDLLRWLSIRSHPVRQLLFGARHIAPPSPLSFLFFPTNPFRALKKKYSRHTLPTFSTVRTVSPLEWLSALFIVALLSLTDLYKDKCESW